MVGRLALPVLALGLVSAAETSARAGKTKQSNKPTVAVTDLRARGVDDVAAGALTTEVTNTISQLRVFQVISGEDIKRLLNLQETKAQCTGEADAACMAEIGGALGVDFLVYGEVAKLGDTFSLSLALLDTGKANALSRENKKVAEKGKLLAEAESLARAVMRPLLESRRGYLVLEVREGGARIEVDGRTVGVAPLAGRLDLTMGPHEVAISKDGFVPWARTLDVQSGEVSVEPVSLVPNQDFISDYEGRAARTRTFAWITGAAAAGLLATAGALRIVDDARFSDLSSKKYLQRGTACAASSPSYNGTDFCPTDLGRQNGVVQTVSSIERLDDIALGAGLAGVLSAAVSAVLFATGDPPGRYSAYSAGPVAGPKTSLEIGLAGVRISGAF
jgi:TolB-like protein